MPEGIVDDLETIEVDEKQRDLLVAAAGVRQCVDQAIAEQRAVGKSGQRIVEGKILDLLFSKLALGNVFHGAFDEAEFPIAIAHGAKIRNDPSLRPISSIELDLNIAQYAFGFKLEGDLTHLLGANEQLSHNIWHLCHKLFRRVVTVDLGQGAIDAHGAAIEGSLKDADHGILKDGAIFLFGLANLCIGDDQFGRARRDFPLELLTMIPKLLVARFDLVEHAIEGSNQKPEFITALQMGSYGVIMVVGNSCGGTDQIDEWLRNRPLQPRRNTSSEEQGQQEHRDKNDAVSTHGRVQL